MNKILLHIFTGTWLKRKGVDKLHWSCEEITLYDFLRCLADRDYSRLVISGNPSQEMRLRAWKSIQYDFAIRAKPVYIQLHRWLTVLIGKRLVILEGFENDPYPDMKKRVAHFQLTTILEPEIKAVCSLLERKEIKLKYLLDLVSRIRSCFDVEIEFRRIPVFLRLLEEFLEDPIHGGMLDD